MNLKTVRHEIETYIAHLRLLPEYRSPAAMDLMLAAQQMVAAQAAAQAATAAYYQHTVSTTAAATSAAPGAPVFAPPINHMRMNPQAPPAPGFGLLPAPPMNLGMGGMGQPPPPPPPQQALNQHAFGDHATASGNDYNQCVFNIADDKMLSNAKSISFADVTITMSMTIGIGATTAATTENGATVETAGGTETGTETTGTGSLTRAEATGIGIGGGADRVRGPGLATGAATEAETGVLAGDRLVIEIGLRGGIDATGPLQDRGDNNYDLN